MPALLATRVISGRYGFFADEELRFISDTATRGAFVVVSHLDLHLSVKLVMN
jgi:hypothetical protein